MRGIFYEGVFYEGFHLYMRGVIVIYMRVNMCVWCVRGVF